MSKLIAFDQALNTTGYAIFDNGSLVAYDKFTTESYETHDKLKEIRTKVLELIEEHLPNEIAIEEIQLQQIPGSSAHGNVETFKKLAYVQATILEIVSETDHITKYHVVPSSSWKSTCGVKGRARAEQKRNAQLFVSDEFGVKAIQDICDAICIGKHIIEDGNKEINWE